MHCHVPGRRLLTECAFRQKSDPTASPRGGRNRGAGPRWPKRTASRSPGHELNLTRLDALEGELSRKLAEAEERAAWAAMRAVPRDVLPAISRAHVGCDERGLGFLVRLPGAAGTLSGKDFPMNVDDTVALLVNGQLFGGRTGDMVVEGSNERGDSMTTAQRLSPKTR
jgi:hypothetical protein